MELHTTKQTPVADGCRDPLVVWSETLIDGHNRYEVCSRLKIKFKTVAMEFENRSEAKEWIIRNQFGRRNLSAYERSKLALALESEIAARAKERQAHGSTAPGKTLVPTLVKALPANTQFELASIAGVSHGTMAKVKVIEEKARPEIKA